MEAQIFRGANISACYFFLCVLYSAQTVNTESILKDLKKRMNHCEPSYFGHQFTFDFFKVSQQQQLWTEAPKLLHASVIRTKKGVRPEVVVKFKVRRRWNSLAHGPNNIRAAQRKNNTQWLLSCLLISTIKAFLPSSECRFHAFECCSWGISFSFSCVNKTEWTWLDKSFEHYNLCPKGISAQRRKELWLTICGTCSWGSHWICRWESRYDGGYPE